MNQLAQELDEKLQTLDPARARHLESLVRVAMDQVEHDVDTDPNEIWPERYFENTAGALVGEEFERPQQGDLPQRDPW